jgi:flagellar assembly protein FliH
MTSYKTEAPFVASPLWALPSEAFALEEVPAEEAPFRPIGLAACIRPAAEIAAEVEEDRAAGEAPTEPEALPPSEALEALLEQAREEAHQAGEAEGDAAGFARGLAEGEAQGREAAYAEGLAAGQAQAAETHDALLQRLDGIAEALASAQEPLTEQLDAFRRLTLHLVETVLRRALGSGEDFLTPLVERALEALDERDAGAVTVSLNPDDYAALAEALGARFRDLKFMEDAAVSVGSVRLYAGATVIDDFIQQRLETLAREWLGEQQGWRPERLGTPLTPKAREVDDVAEAEWRPVEGDAVSEPDVVDSDEAPSGEDRTGELAPNEIPDDESPSDDLSLNDSSPEEPSRDESKP